MSGTGTSSIMSANCFLRLAGSARVHLDRQLQARRRQVQRQQLRHRLPVLAVERDGVRRVRDHDVHVEAGHVVVQHRLAVSSIGLDCGIARGSGAFSIARHSDSGAVSPVVGSVHIGSFRPTQRGASSSSVTRTHFGPSQNCFIIEAMTLNTRQSSRRRVSIRSDCSTRPPACCASIARPD
jgi:hypothetical protein